MTDNIYYLKPEVYFEPLCNNWYAWPYLIPPVTFARNAVNTHKRLMTSFVKNYKLHQLAKKNPAMVGGSFVDCSEEQVAQIRTLISDLDDKHADLVALSDAITELEVMLSEHDKSQSIEPLYTKIPSILSGYIELFVDQNHNPSYRLIEPLLYSSEFYKPQLQSALFGSMEYVEHRPFVFSTPRLADNNHLHAELEFNSEGLKQLLSSRYSPLSMAEISAIFESANVTGGLPIDALFTTEKPAKSHTPVTEGVRVEYTGHAGFMIETAKTCVMIDPVIATAGVNSDEELIGFSELPEKIDYVLLTHSHQDHMNIETLLQLRERVGTVVVPKNNGGGLFDPSMKLILKQLEFAVYEIEDMERIQFPGGEGYLQAVPFLGEHGDLNIRSKSAWFINASGKKCYFGADSSNLDLNMYKHIHREIGKLDLLSIGMECVGAPYTWLYGGLVTQFIPQEVKNARRLNGSDFEKAKSMAEVFQPEQITIYALGLEKAYGYFMGIDYTDDSEQIIQSQQMVDFCIDQGIEVERAYCRKTLHYK